MKRRVVITGLGVVTPLGHQVDVYWKGLLEGANAVDTLQNFSPERLLVRFGAEIRGFNPLDYFSKSEANRMDRVSHFAVVAAMSAIEDSGLELEKMVGFRNRIIHRYWEVDLEEVYRIFKERIEDFKRFEREIIRFIERLPD
ncbi:MAG: DUF86 domain-containing protein [Planctomycetota bacterium]|nr:MAG: DUF86 domain-containing protein [Planctomycetota bacterium]